MCGEREERERHERLEPLFKSARARFLIIFSLSIFYPGYFSQFGAITRLRVSRNKKTAKARSYGFIEFASADVAQIAAEAMDG